MQLWGLVPASNSLGMKSQMELLTGTTRRSQGFPEGSLPHGVGLGGGCQPSVRQWVCLSGASSRGSPREGLGEPHAGPPGYPGTGPVLSRQSSVHAPRSATQMSEQLDLPRKTQLLPTLPRRWATWRSGASPSPSCPLRREGRRGRQAGCPLVEPRH